MSVAVETFDSLPRKLRNPDQSPVHADPTDIDPPPSTEALARARQLLDAALEPTAHASTFHPSVSTSYTPNFSPLVSETHARLEAGQPLRDSATNMGIDLARYEEPEAPSSELDNDDASATLAAWRQAVRKAYTSHEYLAQRSINLGLLERFGKNAWLIANAQVEEQVLQPVERELEATQAELERVQAERRQQQERVQGELEGLEETWRTTVGRTIEAEVATEAMRRQLLERRREESGRG